jgi:hypothetical protein
VPRYRQRLASVPFGQGRAVWVEDAQDPAVTSEPARRSVRRNTYLREPCAFVGSVAVAEAAAA